jgi:hypothetical protein
MGDIQGIQGNPQCSAEYPNRRHGDRIIRCHLQAGHSGLHEEAETEVTWEPDPRPVSVLAVTLMPPDGMNSTSYTESLMRLFGYDASTSGTLIRGGGPMMLPASPLRLVDMRNMAARFLLDESEADWLLFIDSDMGFDEDALEKLLEAADPATRPVIGALCFGLRKEETDNRGGWRTVPFPTIYDWRHTPGAPRPGFVLRYDYTPNAVTQVSATGAAFLLIHRTALEKMRAELGDTWFDRAKMHPDEDMMGEDISFCARLGRLGIPLFVHTGVQTTHLKPVWVDEDYYQGMRYLAAASRAEVAKDA